MYIVTSPAHGEACDYRDLRTMVEYRDAMVAEYLQEHDEFERIYYSRSTEERWRTERALAGRRMTIDDLNSNMRTLWLTGLLSPIQVPCL